jgi:hypothetical protein
MAGLWRAWLECTVPDAPFCCGNSWPEKRLLKGTAPAGSIRCTCPTLQAPYSGEVFNVCDNGPISQTELYQRLAEKTGLPLPPPTAISPNRKRAWTNKRVSNLKLLRTGWTPEYPDIFAAINNQGLNVLAGTAEDFMST